MATFNTPLYVASSRRDGSRDHPRRRLPDSGHHATTDRSPASLSSQERRRGTPSSPPQLRRQPAPRSTIESVAIRTGLSADTPRSVQPSAGVCFPRPHWLSVHASTNSMLPLFPGSGFARVLQKLRMPGELFVRGRVNQPQQWVENPGHLSMVSICSLKVENTFVVQGLDTESSPLQE